jgi:hypothetical protein
MSTEFSGEPLEIYTRTRDTEGHSTTCKVNLPSLWVAHATNWIARDPNRTFGSLHNYLLNAIMHGGDYMEMRGYGELCETNKQLKSALRVEARAAMLEATQRTMDMARKNWLAASTATEKAEVRSEVLEIALEWQMTDPARAEELRKIVS